MYIYALYWYLYKYSFEMNTVIIANHVDGRNFHI